MNARRLSPHRRDTLRRIQDRSPLASDILTRTVAELVEEGLVEVVRIAHRDRLVITDAGVDALERSRS